MQKKGKVKFIQPNKDEFFSTLKKRVDNYFKETGKSKNANATMVIKSIVLIGSYLIPFVLMLFWAPPVLVAILLWLIMGIALAGIGMSVMHDANHGAYSSNDKVNFLMGHTLNLLGGSVFNWKLQHNILHHTYTNIAGMDEDIDDKVLMRFSPHTPTKKVYKAQWIYAFGFYGLLTLYWVVAKDFIQFMRYTKNGVNPNSAKENRSTLTKMILIKIIYVGIFLVIPMIISPLPFWIILLGFLLLHFAAGMILTTIFQLAHTVEGTDHPLPTEAGHIENCWAMHQMQTTVNFSRKNKLLSWYIGGLNFQVEHHLFPRICHIHYPEISEIVKSTAEEFGVPYLENETFGQALQSHIRTLRRFGAPDINEAIG